MTSGQGSDETFDLEPGLALDAGCGKGSEAIWLAVSGWRVTAVDFSVTALEHGRSTAQTVGADVAERIEALDPREWQIVVAEERRRAAADTGVDAVVRAVYRR